jgi:hypothetical protein
MLEESCQ